jgi:replication-associated recombination protein RarA
VPLHLRNAPTRLMKKEGYGKEYHYPHDNPDHFIEEHYFPVGMKEIVLYIFSDSGFAKKISATDYAIYGSNDIRKIRISYSINTTVETLIIEIT